MFKDNIAGMVLGFVMGCAIAGGAIYKFMDYRHKAYAAAIEAQYQAQLADSLNKEKQIEQANAKIKADYDSRVAVLNARINQLRTQGSSTVSADTAAAAGFNAEAANILADPVTLILACTQTTVMAQGLQEYVNNVIAITNGSK